MSINKFQQLINNPFLFRLYLLKRLPLAFIAGLKVKELTDEKGIVTVKYRWLTQNPFKSMYFACLSMAAEMSTGLLVLNGVYNSDPPVSMLITKNQAVFHKKAVGNITFICSDGTALIASINKAKLSGEGIEMDATSVGTDETGAIVAEFIFTWSLKAKV